LKEIIMPSVTKTYTGMCKNCGELIIAQIGEKDYFTSYYNRAFYGCDKLINYNSLNDVFSILNFTSSGSAVYSLKNSDDCIVESADDLLFLWDSYYINKTVNNSTYDSSKRFDSTALFDVNGDGIVNAKDYAIINSDANEI
jgi:hypothetical protein